MHTAEIKSLTGAGVLTQWLRTFVTLADDPDLISSTHMVIHNGL